jgi:hypothetical protein
MHEQATPNDILTIVNIHNILRNSLVPATAPPVNWFKSPVEVLVGCPIPRVPPLLKPPEVLPTVLIEVMDIEPSTTTTGVSARVSEISTPLIVVIAPGISV